VKLDAGVVGLYVPFPVTVAVAVKIAEPLHVASSGPYSLKVIVPVGDWPPDRVAWSVIDAPIVTEAVALVEIDGEALLTVLDSPVSPHEPAIGELLASPL
jgi:hypothetical protein